MSVRELLTVTQMTEADRLAVAAGVPSLTLMENAGRAVADEAAKMVPPGSRIVVLCGPGNNGGDGYVAARLLAERGFAVEVGALVDRNRLQGDAAEMARRCPSDLIAASWSSPLMRLFHGRWMIVDAIFGAGLARPAAADFAAAIELSNEAAAAGVPVLAVDVPSGVDGTSGQAIGHYVIAATRTVTFFRRKPGHLLLPGRTLSGDVVVADIGIPERVLDKIAPAAAVNAPSVALRAACRPAPGGHKYARGHVLAISGPMHATGAARLAARAALRAGAGAVTLASPPDAVAVNAAHLTAVMIQPFADRAQLAAVMAARRVDAVVVGPANGVGAETCERMATVLKHPSQPAVVIDADALTSFEGRAETLFAMLRGREGVVLTPHEGEFRRLFGEVTGSKIERACAAAARSGSVIVLKGADTVIAAPDGRVRINDNAPASLATAGSGDVLAGIMAGLLAQGRPAFEAACDAVWLHGACGGHCGVGLIAEDLPEALPAVLNAL